MNMFHFSFAVPRVRPRIRVAIRNSSGQNSKPGDEKTMILLCEDGSLKIYMASR